LVSVYIILTEKIPDRLVKTVVLDAADNGVVFVFWRSDSAVQLVHIQALKLERNNLAVLHISFENYHAAIDTLPRDCHPKHLIE
jgi:hypothetical protein